MSGARLIEEGFDDEVPDAANDDEPAEKSARSRAATASNEDRCYSCRGRKVDRFGFDCTTCFGSGKRDD